MPQFIHNFTSYFYEKQRDLYFVAFTQVKRGPMGFPDVDDPENIPGRRDLLKWLAENLPDTEVGPIFAYDSDSGIITMPYDGSIFLNFTPEDQKKFEEHWETPDGKSKDSRWQCYVYPLSLYKENHGGRIPPPWQMSNND